MPVIPIPHRALPARFRRLRVLIVGCGDVGQRVAALGAAAAARGPRLLALTSQAARMPALRALGVQPLLGNLDDARSLRRLAGVAQRVLHLAPPPSHGMHDTRTAHLLQALARRTPPKAVVYASTTGVYGNCQGAWVSETRAVAPHTARAHRRVDAERRVQAWGRRVRGPAAAPRTTVLRVPGIYASNREGGTPRTRLLKGLPVLHADDDVYTNHIHADDLARACWLALWRGRAQRVLHVCDDTVLRMGDYIDAAADLYGLPRPPRLRRADAQAVLPPMMLSFMGESRRLHNQRLKRELRLQLRYPTVHEGLRA